jgi:hypothetical protein
MGKYYISLCRCLIGACIEVYAPSEIAVRLYASKYLGKLWCSVYANPNGMNIIGSKVIVDEDGEE